MTLDEFREWLLTQPLQDKLVYMKYKYSWDDNWIESNKYLEFNIDCDDYYIWLNDWYEGQQDVVILGCIDIDEIKIPLFEPDRFLPSSFVNHIYNRFLFK